LNIGYRRVSGKIGLTSFELGQRGSWVEKRIALINYLKSKNHTISFLSSFTDETKSFVKNNVEDYNLLILEFGRNNLLQNGKDWEQTNAIVKKHIGHIIFICDDPDLSYHWNMLKNEDFSRWTILVNAKNKESCKKALKIPDKARILDIPFHHFLKKSNFSNSKIPNVVYIGNSSGRNKIFQNLTLSKHLIISGRAKEWLDYPNLRLTIMPQQKDRMQFYKMFYGCLAVCDNKHNETQWRTGRAYHGLHSGIPVLTIKGNLALNWGYNISNYQEIDSFITLSNEKRQEIYAKQSEIAQNDKGDIEKLDEIF